MCLNSYFEGIWRWHLSFLMLFAISTANNSCIYVFRHLINANAINLPQDHKTQRGTHTHLAHTRATHSQQITHNNNNNEYHTRHSQLTWSQNVVLGEQRRCARSCLLHVVAVLQTTLNINMLGANNADDDDDNDGAAADAAAPPDSKRRDREQEQQSVAIWDADDTLATLEQVCCGRWAANGKVPCLNTLRVLGTHSQTETQAQAHTLKEAFRAIVGRGQQVRVGCISEIFRNSAWRKTMPDITPSNTHALTALSLS